MTPKEKQEIAETLSQVLDEHRGVPAEAHEQHHEFIEVCIERKRDQVMFWRSVRKQVFGWGIIVMLSGTGLAVADWVEHVLKLKN